MTDILERLGRDLMGISYDEIDAMVREARAEIERLRAALDRAADALEFYDNKAEALKARAALDEGLPTADDVRGILREREP